MGLSIQEAISKVKDKWMEIEGVEGVGEGKENDKDCILVLVRCKTAEIEKAIPTTFEGFPVKVIESGVIQAQKEKKKR